MTYRERIFEESAFRPPYRYESSEHGPVTIYDAVDVGWIARVKESLPHKEALARAMVEGLNAAALDAALTALPPLILDLLADHSATAAEIAAELGFTGGPKALRPVLSDLHKAGKIKNDRGWLRGRSSVWSLA